MNKITVEELLFNDEPITINRKLAKCIGLTEAVIFQQIHYWLKINEKKKSNFKEGRYWTYNTIKKWHEEEFDFLSEGTVKRTLQKLEKIGLLESNTFNKMKGDKTKWYTINYNELIKICEKELKRKEQLSAIRSLNGKLGAEIKKDKTTNTIGAICSNDPWKQIAPTMEANCSDHGSKLLQAIPKTSTKTSTKISTSSSSKPSDIELVEIFESNICKLMKTTYLKFLKLVENNNKDFLIAIIEECTTTNVKSFKGFEAALKNYINANCTNAEEVHSYAKAYSKSNKNSNKTKSFNKFQNSNNKLKFINFEQREYNYDELERKLLGWDCD